MRAARSMMPIARSVPAITKEPSLNSMSAAAASSTCAAISRPCSITLAAAFALDQADLVEGNAELRGQDLRERRGVPHAEIHRAGEQGDAAVRLEDDAAQLLGGRR